MQMMEDFITCTLPPGIESERSTLGDTKRPPLVRIDSTMVQTPYMIDCRSANTSGVLPTVNLDCGRLETTANVLNPPCPTPLEAHRAARKRKAGKSCDAPPKKKGTPAGFYSETYTTPTSSSTFATTASTLTTTISVPPNFDGAVTSGIPNE